MAKKNGGKAKGNAGKKTGKKTGVFKALKKNERRSGLADKKDPHSIKRKAKGARRHVSDEFRNFDERMAARSARKPGLVAKTAVAAPSFVMAAPTFQLNVNPVQPAPAVREVEGFHGFMSALEAPKDAPMNPNQENRKTKLMQPEYRGSNVFAVLDDGDEEQKPQRAAQAAPALMQPATFSFATAKPTFTPQSSLQASLHQSMQPVAVNGLQDIDPDL